MMSDKKNELAGVWRDWKTDPPEERHGDSEGSVVVRWQDAGGIRHTMLPWHNDGKRPHCEWLDTTPEALQVDNGDGTVTLYGVPVIVRDMPPGHTLEKVVVRDNVVVCEPSAPPPSWKPPVSLPDGVYGFENTPIGWLANDSTGGSFYPAIFYRDFNAPSRPGYWRVKDGTAEYLGAEWKGGAE